MRTRQTLTLAEAQKIAAGARAEAEKNQWLVTVAIVDEGGALLALERMDGAPPQSPEIATKKAWTAAMTRTPTKTLEDLVKERPATGGFPGQLRVQGGVPIKAGNECVGGAGASGAASHQDEQCVRAGLAAAGLG